MQRILLILVFSILQSTLLATAQRPDYLIIERDTFPIFSNPLEPYFAQKGSRDLIQFNNCWSTACWRGYIAFWELKNDSLFLVSIESCVENCEGENSIDLKREFGTNKVFANWFSGDLVIPDGKMLQYIHMGYGSVFERTIFIKIEDGVQKNRKVKSNHKLARQLNLQTLQFRVSKEAQDTLFHFVKTNIDWSYEKINLVHMCDDSYILTFSPKGKIKKIRFTPYADTKWEDLWYNISETRCRMIIKKALKPADLSYLDLPEKKFEIEIEIFYDSETKELENWKDDYNEY